MFQVESMFNMGDIERFSFPAAIISRTPNILLVGMDIGAMGFKKFVDGSNSIFHFEKILGDDGHLCVNPWWYVVGNEFWEDRLKIISQVYGDRKHTHAHILCNCPTEVKYVREKFGIHALLLNQNIFVHEENFIVDRKEIIFDAVYNAKIAWFKRHWLAAELKNLALIYSSYSDSEEYYNFIRATLPNAAFLNGHPFLTEYRKFTGPEICSIINKSKVGLCLSEVEGAMYSSVEYLLCGLPVVSTHNTGGRNETFGEEYCRIVDDNVGAIAMAVEELISLKFNPHEIRLKTLAKISHGRKNFVDFVNNIKICNGSQPDGADALVSIMKPDWAVWVWKSIGDLRTDFQ